MSASAITPTGTAGEEGRTALLLRRSLLVLAAGAILATATELAMLRHWDGTDQIIPWLALGVLAAALVARIAVDRPLIVRTVRWTSVVVALSGLYGVYEHVKSNHSSGPLDFRYSDKWESMSFVSRWWAAATESVGPSPPIAPAALCLAAACLALSTLGLVARPSRGQA